MSDYDDHSARDYQKLDEENEGELQEEQSKRKKILEDEKKARMEQVRKRKEEMRKRAEERKKVEQQQQQQQLNNSNSNSNDPTEDPQEEEDEELSAPNAGKKPSSPTLGKKLKNTAGAVAAKAEAIREDVSCLECFSDWVNGMKQWNWKDSIY